MKACSAIIPKILLVLLSASCCEGYCQASPESRKDGRAGRFYYTNYAGEFENETRSGARYGFQCDVPKDVLPLLPPNFLTNVFDEVQCDAFCALVRVQASAKDTNHLKPQFMASACDSPVSVRICFAILDDCESEASETFEQRARFYVRCRSEGHSSNYVWAALMETRTNYAPRPDCWPRILREEYAVPTNWVRKLEDHTWLVIDGPLAWNYLGDFSVQVRDAQEYDPRLRENFLKAKADVANMRSTLTADPDVLLKSVLLKKYGIRWRTPFELHELNPRRVGSSH